MSDATASEPPILAGFDMGCTCVVGLQWGDEAKGKIVDLLADRHDFVVRYNGGANAGHTVVRNGRTFKLSLFPTGILDSRRTAVIGNGVVIYPPRFREELEQLRSAGVEIGGNLAVSDQAHVIFPYHLEEERLREQDQSQSIGTTGRGIGPCYMDKLGRASGIRVGELFDASRLREHLSAIVPQKNRLLQALTSDQTSFAALSAAKIADEYLALAEDLRPFVTDTTALLHRALREKKSMLFEAAQGSLLDVDHGTYPYVTSSNSTPAGIWSGTGVPSRRLDRIVGVLKAYTSRVGRGPFPSELTDDTGERIRKVGREYGTVTGRPRRVGWFDAVAARYSAAISDADELSLMLLDVLSGLPELAIATAYETPSGHATDFPADANRLDKCRPVLETHRGWEDDIGSVRRRRDLPDAARRYVDRIEALLERPVRIISVGPDRDQTILE
jgi:adenylosuccinate synthase